MLTVELTKQQGQFLIQVTFSIRERGITALYGPSGSGKSSIIDMIAGLKKPDWGSITVNDDVLYDSLLHVCLPPEKRCLGYIFQDSRLFPHLSVKQNLTFGMKLLKKNQRKVNFDQVVELLGIGHILYRRPAKLSGGEKQRIAIGRALLSSPAALLMDEPFASLDKARRSEILPFIRELSIELNIPILYVSHSPNEIIKLADHIIMLDQGKIKASGRIDEIFSELDIKELRLKRNCDFLNTTINQHMNTSKCRKALNLQNVS